MGTHVVAEVFYDGTWHMFDPSYASFFYSEKEYTGQGRVFSARSLFAQPQIRTHILALGVKKFTGTYTPYEAIRAIDDTEALQLYSVLFTNSFPNRSHENGTGAVFPVEFNLMHATHTSFGSIDNQTSDVYDAVQDGKFQRYRGDVFLGAIPARSSSHMVLFRIPEPGTCSFTYYFRGNAIRNCLGVIEMKGAMVLSERIEDVPDKPGVWSWTVTFAALETDPILLVELRQVSYLDGQLMALPVDAITADFARHTAINMTQSPMQIDEQR